MWVQDNRRIVYDNKRRQWVLIVDNIYQHGIGKIIDLRTQNTQRAKELAGGGEWVWQKD